jgi:hypothetical protein
MPWLIQHKCRPDQADNSHYAILRGERDGVPLTRITCPNASCREEFYILGHEMFEEAHSSDEINRQTKLTGLPPGFVIARTRPAPD